MIKKYVQYFKNMLKYVKSGGVVLVNVSFTQPNKRLVGKTIFISGGTSGIGKNMAKTFMEEGATVIVSGRKEENLKELNAAYPEIHTIKWDISDIHSAPDNIAELDKKYGPIDVFVNNAGVYDAASWDSITEASFDKCADINQKALFFMCQAEGKYMVSHDIKGKIINITSIAGIKSGFDPYSVSKWGATCITKGLAKELVHHGIVVNGIAPGNVVTNIHDGVKGKDVKDNAFMPSHLTNRYTLVEEISSLATFLASDSSNNIIGQIISVDGGWTLQ